MTIKFARTVQSVINLNKKGYAFTKALDRDFSLSENPLGFSKTVSKAIIRALPNINKYPKKNITVLKNKISRRLKIPTASICLGNGSEQLIDGIFRILVNPDDPVVIPLPAFILFEKAAVSARAKILFLKPDRRMGINIDLIKISLKRNPKIIIMANPNSPTGQTISKKKVLALAKKAVNTLIVVDEANIEFNGLSLIKEASRLSNIMVLRTFSKGYGLAGLRVGFAVSGIKTIQALKELIQPFPVNSLGAAAAAAAIDDDDFITQTRLSIAQEKAKLTNALAKAGIIVFPSQTNNILIRTDFSKFSLFCLKNKISIVDCSSWRGLGKGFFRISLRAPSQNQLLINLLQTAYK